MSTQIDTTELVDLLQEARHYHEALQWQFVIEHDERFNDDHFIDRVDAALQRHGVKTLSPVCKAGVSKTSIHEAPRSKVDADPALTRSVA